MVDITLVKNIYESTIEGIGGEVDRGRHEQMH